MSYAGLIETFILTALVLWWVRRSKLDLGLRAPAWRPAWPWIALWVAVTTAEAAIALVYPIEVDPEWVEELERLSFVEKFLLYVLLAPIFEELVFRGALFAALLRRWGIWPAVIVPSLLWALVHTQYGGWLIVSLAVWGATLAMIRWKSGSLYLPLALHAGFNLIGVLSTLPPAG